MTRQTGQRVLLGSEGVLLIGFGVLTMIDEVALRGLVWLPIWLAGAVATDDGILLPLALAAGWLMTRWRRTGATFAQVAIVRAALVCIAVTTLIALAPIARQGKGANSTVLARNYLRDWLLLETAVVVVAATAYVTVTVRRHRSPTQP